MITVAGVVIIGGSGTSGPALSDATPAALGAAAAGVSADASRADHVHAAPTGGVTTDDFSSATPWTAVQGLGTAAITAGVGSCSVASGASANSPNRPSLSRALPAHDGWAVVDVAVRIAAFTGTLGSPRALLNLSTETDGANSAHTGTPTDFGVSAGVNAADGTGFIGDFNSAAGYSPRASPGTASIALDGTGWLRIIVHPDRYVVLTGVGATYAAAVWTPRHTQAITWASRRLATVSLAGYRSDVQAEVHTVTWDDLVMVVR